MRGRKERIPPPEFPATNRLDAILIALAKAELGKLTYASMGNGTTTHMSGELFRYVTGVHIRHIPFKGSGQATIDLIGGQVHIMFDNIPSSLPHIRSENRWPCCHRSKARFIAVYDAIPASVGKSRLARTQALHPEGNRCHMGREVVAGTERRV